MTTGSPDPFWFAAVESYVCELSREGSRSEHGVLDAVNLACEANAVEMSRAFGSRSVHNARRPMKVPGGKAAVKQRAGEIEELASTARDESQK